MAHWNLVIHKTAKEGFDSAVDALHPDHPDVNMENDRAETNHPYHKCGRCGDERHQHWCEPGHTCARPNMACHRREGGAYCNCDEFVFVGDRCEHRDNPKFHAHLDHAKALLKAAALAIGSDFMTASASGHVPESDASPHGISLHVVEHK